MNIKSLYTVIDTSQQRPTEDTDIIGDWIPAGANNPSEYLIGSSMNMDALNTITWLGGWHHLFGFWETCYARCHFPLPG